MRFECFQKYDHEPSDFVERDVVDLLDKFSTKHALASLIEILAGKGILTVDDLNEMFYDPMCRITKIVNDR